MSEKRSEKNESVEAKRRKNSENFPRKKIERTSVGVCAVVKQGCCSTQHIFRERSIIGQFTMNLFLMTPVKLFGCLCSGRS